MPRYKENIRIFLYLLPPILFFTGFSFFYPPNDPDSIRYGYPGNPFYLQLLDTLHIGNWGSYFHGRYISHTIGRFALQAGEPILNIFYGAINTFILFSALNYIKPNFYRENDLKFLHTILFVTFLFMMCMSSFFANFFLPLYVLSYYLPPCLILFFLSPYIEGTEPKHKLIFYIAAFCAGNSHEQSIAVLPLLALIYFISKKQVPKLWNAKWGKLGILGFVLGHIIVVASAFSPARLRDYGGIDSWEFLGHIYNWNALGLSKYFYSFIKHYFTGSNPYFILTLPFVLVLVFFWVKNYKKNSDFFSFENISPVYLLTLSYLSTGVMILSPKFYHGSVDFGKFFLFTALGQSYYTWLKNRQKSPLIFNCFISALMIIVFAIQIGISYGPAVRFYQITSILKKASKEKLSYVEIPQATPAQLDSPFGRIYISGRKISPEAMETRYSIPKVVVLED